MVLHWRKLCEVDNECTLHLSIILAICMLKMIKFGGDLTKFWQKQVGSFFGTPCIYSLSHWLCAIFNVNLWFLLFSICWIIYKSLHVIINCCSICLCFPLYWWTPKALNAAVNAGNLAQLHLPFKLYQPTPIWFVTIKKCAQCLITCIFVAYL